MTATFRADTPMQTDAFTREELALAARNHALPLEALRYPLTPIGLHYLLIHFDIPAIAGDWRLMLGGRVERPAALTLDELVERPQRTLAVTLECAGNGRALLEPRAASQPWLTEAVGTAAWTGTPLAPLLRQAGLAPTAREVVFTGLDRGAQGGVVHAYARSLPLAEALGENVLLAWEMNGAPLPPQHGYPLRLIVPGWYGMAQVKWLASIDVVDEPFGGWQQQTAYRLRTSESEVGDPVTRMLPRALMVPPGMPDFFSRTRLLTAGQCLLQGRAWSGLGPLKRVEISVDHGPWQPAALDEPLSPWAWRGWHWIWDAKGGEHDLRCRATDASDHTQPDHATWNLEGYCNTSPQKVYVTVSA